MTVEQLNVIITAQNTEFKRRLDEVNGRLDDMSDTAQRSADKTYSIFQGLGNKIAALGIGKIIADSIKEGMNAIESESLFEVSLGGYADSAREWSEKLSNSLGLDEYAIRKNVGILYTMTQSMGVSKDAAFEMSKGLTVLAEDMASFYNITTEEAQTKLQSGITGEMEPLRRLGILVDETTVKQYAYKNGIAEVGAELTQTQKVLARYAAIMDQTSTAQGDLARTIDSPANKMRMLKNEVKEIMIDTGSALMPTVSSILSIANSGLQMISPVITDIAEGVNDVSQAILTASPQTKQLLTLTIAAAVAIPAVTKATALLTAAKAGYNTILSLLIPKQLTFGAALKATARWIGVIAGALAIFSLINDQTEQTKAVNDSAADSFKDEKKGADEAADGVDNLADSMDGLGEAVKGSLASVDKLNILRSGSSGSIVSGFVTPSDLDLLADVEDAVANVKETVGGFGLDFDFDFSFEKLYESIKNTWKWLTTDGWNSLKDGISKLWDNATRYVTEDLFPFWKNIGSNLYKALFGTEEERYEALKYLDDTFKGFFGDSGEDWSNFWEDIGNGIHQFAEGDLLGGLQTINSKFESLFGDIGAMWSKEFQRMGSEMYETFNGGKIDEIELHSKYSDLVQQIQLATNEYIRQGMSAEKALEMAERDYLNSSEAIYFYENLAQNRRTLEEVQAAEQTIRMQGYDYTDMQTLDKFINASAVSADFANTRPDWTVTPSNISLTGPQPGIPPINIFMDGEEISYHVTSGQTREQTRSNGY